MDHFGAKSACDAIEIGQCGVPPKWTFVICRSSHLAQVDITSVVNVSFFKLLVFKLISFVCSYPPNTLGFMSIKYVIFIWFCIWIYVGISTYYRSLLIPANRMSKSKILPGCVQDGCAFSINDHIVYLKTWCQ